MTKTEILNICKWNNHNETSVVYDIPYLGIKEIVLLPSNNTQKDLPDNIVSAFNNLININLQEFEHIKKYLYWVCKVSCESITYGDYDIDVDWKNGETEFEANMRFFGVKNENDAFEKSDLESIEIINNGEVTLWFYADWGSCGLNLIDGKWDDFA